MHLAIDLRFLSIESYGISVYLKELLPYLLPQLIASQNFGEVTLVFNQKLLESSPEKVFGWWTLTQNDKIKIVSSNHRHYSVAEQSQFLSLLNGLKPDLTYFFNFNFPILFDRPFVYNILDLTLVKRRSPFIKKQIMQLVLRTGARKARHIFFLGEQTKIEAEQFFRYKFMNSSVILAGVNQKYLEQKAAEITKSQITGLEFDSNEKTKLDIFKKEHKITKPYFLFVSVWKKHKNLERLVAAFEQFQLQNQHKHQLILVGSKDHKCPEVIARVENSLEFKANHIIVTGRVEEDDLIRLQDGAEAYILPSTSEGFGLGLIEAASRGTVNICSNLEIFDQILGKSRFIFNPGIVTEITEAMQKIVNQSPEIKQKIQQEAFQISSQYRWEKVSQSIFKVLEQQICLVRK